MDWVGLEAVPGGPCVIRLKYGHGVIINSDLQVGETRVFGDAKKAGTSDQRSVNSNT